MALCSFGFEWLMMIRMVNACRAGGIVLSRPKMNPLLQRKLSENQTLWHQKISPHTKNAQDLPVSTFSLASNSPTPAS
jgi:hypothetical protein